jgi:hypothetical protein
MNEHEVTSKVPKDCSEAELADFVSLVLTGEEVTAHGLEDRVRRAECLSFLRYKSCFVGVAGLKRPSQNHRCEVSRWSGVALPEELYPFELGWIFILPSARSKKLSLPLCAPLVETAGSHGTFATSKTDNRGMHITLQKLGFVSAGAPYKSPHRDHRLQLFVRVAQQTHY